MKTILSHFYNEEYLLPWWLHHHKKYFDHGIMIDYHSTDQSVSIIKSICPDWEVVTTTNDFFDAKKVDQEIMYYESKLLGWKITLNTTEFLYGDYTILKDNLPPTQYFISSLFFASNPELEEYPNAKFPLHNQLTKALDFNIPKNNFRSFRSIHNYNVEYTTGRHWDPPSDLPDSKLKIFYYGYAPYNEIVINRKLQIQDKIPQTDKDIGAGWQHLITREQLIHNWKFYYSSAVDVSNEINKFYKSSEFCYWEHNIRP